MHQGSAFDVGFYGIVQKDLRSAMHKPETPDQVYPAGGPCQAGDQECHDAIQFRAIGAISQPLMEWVNRPAFQQADEIQGHAAG
jgi:hypothetical protein